MRNSTDAPTVITVPWVPHRDLLSVWPVRLSMRQPSILNKVLARSPLTHLMTVIIVPSITTVKEVLAIGSSIHVRMASYALKVVEI